MKLIAKELAYATILTMEIPQQDELARQFVADRQKVNVARTTVKESVKVFGKVACALEIRLDNGKKVHAFAPNKTLAEFIADITGQKPPTHAMTLKNTFGGYVLTDLITETDYDLNSSNCLELAGRILSAVKGDLTHDAVVRAAAQLKERSDKEASLLRGILDSVKPVDKMTVEDALEAFEDICASGHVSACLAQLPDEVAKMTESEQKITYVAVAHAVNRLDTKLGDKVDAWANEASETWSPVTIVKADAPAEAVAA
jgi:hypothetical protein